MKLALIQHDIVWEDKAANYARVADLLDQATDAGADTVALPEMFATGFSMDADAIGESAGGPTEQWLVTEATRRKIHVIGTFVETSTTTRRGRNTAIAIAPDGTILARYAKIHPFSMLDEDTHYEPGSTIPVFDLCGFRAAILICYDLRFPESFRTTTLDHHADLFIVPASWPDTRAEHWDLLLRARALENLAYTAGINRVGEGDGLSFDGRSQIISPLGEVLAREASTEAIVMADIDPEHVRETRARFPFLQDAHVRT